MAPFAKQQQANSMRCLRSVSRDCLSWVKIVHWDATGLVLVWKQLEGGTFCWPPITDGTVRLSALQFAALFSGLDYLRLPSERRIPTPTAAA
jgi:transposase